MGLVLGLFRFLPDLNLERHGLPAAGSYLAYPWSLRIKPTWGKEEEGDKREKWGSDDIFEPLIVLYLRLDLPLNFCTTVAFFSCNGLVMFHVTFTRKNPILYS